MFFRACDCYHIPCQHNPGPEHEAAKQRLVEFKKKCDGMSWWARFWNQGSIGREQREILAELKRTDWRLHRKNYG